MRELLGSLHEEEELKSPQLHEISDTVWRELGLPAGEDITFEQWEAFMVQYMRRHAESHANFFLVNATTPAQLFHVLRRQVILAGAPCRCRASHASHPVIAPASSSQIPPHSHLNPKTLNPHTIWHVDHRLIIP